MTERGVCVVTHPLSSAGENATRTLLDILAELGAVGLVTANLPEESTIWDDHEVVEFTSKAEGNSVFVAAFRFVLNQFRMCAILRRRPEGIVLFFGATSYLLPILFVRLIGKTVLVEPRGDVPLTLRLKWEQRMPDQLALGLAGLVRALERAGFAAAHRVVTYTPNMARELGLDPESSKVYPHGARYVDIERFSIQIPFEERDDVVGFVGRLDEEKGIRELAEVAKQLPEGITFRFVGDGPLYDWLESELAVEIDRGEVELTGWVDHDEVPTELNRLKLLVMASHPTEGLPTTILESLACGTPVYATPVSGVPDVVREGGTGFLMRDQRPNQIAQSIGSVVTGDDLLRMSEEGRNLVVEEYSFAAAVKRYDDLLADIK
jgi:glycosyltransferase involved in cell wall biosynthesis